MSATLERTSARQNAALARAEFDGVICFGGVDWWYHNRGHYDLQMMRELSARVPVLYVNSIGMRFPKVGEGAMFLKRIKRKLKSVRRGAVTVREGFVVYSPLSIPGGRARKLSRRLLAWQVRRAARRMGVRRPLVWVACPPAAEVVDALRPVGLVYQRTDRFESFHGVDPVRISGFDRDMKSRADVTLYCSHLLMEEEASQCRNAVFVDHGVDADRFESAGVGASPAPEDVSTLPRPRAGFVGGIDAHTFDPPLFVEVAKSLPEVTFVLVGACSLPEGWCGLPNVRMLGQRPYDEVAGYMAACDVLIMPWNRSPWIEACNPVKLKEYLAVGRPVVTTRFHELGWYEGLVRVAHDAESFAAEIRAALASTHDAAPGRDRVRSATWTAHASRVLEALRESGLTPRVSPEQE
ncbi:MAG: glycosyltransferase [Phycisphaerales bacterium]|nr:MAG: glycosyltransferase [Phycisphaerales bacterium]